MGHSIQLRERKHIKEYGLLLLAKKFDDKYGKNHIDTATKTGTDEELTASEKSSGDLIGNEIANEFIAVKKGKTKHEIPSQETPLQEIYIALEKRKKLMMI